MKLLFIPTIISSLLLASTIVDAAQCSTENCITSQKSFDGVRQYGGLGTKNWSRMVLDKPSKGWFRTEWNKVMAQVVRDQSCAFEEHHPTLVAKAYWSHAYIDSRIKPTRAQARDPNWSNYVWNRRENGDGFVYDGISDALADPLIDNGDGIAKLAVIVSLTSTSGQLIPPQWMRNDSSLTWVEGVNGNGASGNWHVRFDNPEAVEHAADFLTAFLAKYDSEGIHSVTLGEYYFGQKQYHPSDLNRNAYLLGVRNLWEKIIAAAPRDAHDNRVNILQTNPIFNDKVTLDDLEMLGMGMSESDTRLDFPVTKTPSTAAMRSLYDGEKVHVMINGDKRYACRGRTQNWDATPNPFGHRKGYSGIATPQELFWYHSDKGPAPTHSFFLAMAPECKGAPQTAANFIDAIEKFGRCGTETSRWGAAPVAAPMTNDSIANQPVPPPAIAIK